MVLALVLLLWDGNWSSENVSCVMGQYALLARHLGVSGAFISSHLYSENYPE
jgi:hypothetical protein